MAIQKEKFNPLTQEVTVQQLWAANSIRQKIIEQNASGEKFYFLQGPPYTSGRIHLGHAWNNALKDSVIRYKRMQGFNVWDRAGYDMHGLPTEAKVMNKFDLHLKNDIVDFGEVKFAEECTNFCVEMMEIMNKDLTRLGVMMDYDNAYQPIDDKYMEGIWKLIKTAHEKGRLYKGKRTMGWDATYATALAKHEMEYKTITHPSIFVKFKVKGSDENDQTPKYFVIWTTTPWTIPLNLAIMVNPELEYVTAKVNIKNKKSGEIKTEEWVVAKALAGVFLSSVANVEYEIIEEYKGDKLEGTKYEHFWLDKIPALKEISEGYPNAHTVLLSTDHVDTSAGSGLVHCAPGCGPEDYEVGHQNGLPPFNEVDEHGYFPESMGFLHELKAVENDLNIIGYLKEDGALVAKTPITHEYPHGERSKQPIIFRATEQWFFKIEDLKERMLELNDKVHWVPQKSKNAFDSWLDNLRDNSITKQRFWGTPAPIWYTEDNEDPNDIIVVGSKEELESLGATLPESLHKPYIDNITFVKDGKTYKRIPDVLDVWIDAGSASWNCLNTLTNPEEFKEWFPADFILEGKDQIRGWFNLLTLASAIMFDDNAFKNVFVHGFIAGIDGQKMSKSLGNVISPFEVVDKYGADTLRYYTSKIRAGEDISWSWDEVKQHYRNLSIMHNVGNYLLDLIAQHNIDTRTLDANQPIENPDVEEQYILSKTQTAIKNSTELYNSYQMHKIAQEFEELLLETSRTYIQAIRDKQNGELVVRTLYKAFRNLISIAHPIIPFTTEHWYQVFKDRKTLDTQSESILMTIWPKVNGTEQNLELEQSFDSAQKIIQGILACRDKENYGVRWPLQNAYVVGQDKDKLQGVVELLGDMIKTQTNVKELEVLDKFEHVTHSIKPNYKGISKDFGTDTTKVAKALQTLSSEKQNELVAQIKATNKAQITCDDCEQKEIELTKDHIDVIQNVEDGYQGADFAGGAVYISTTVSKELELEGYAREIMRRIQSSRKEQGFEKTDNAKLQVTASQTLLDAIQTFESEIKEKCGLTTIEVVELENPHHESKIKSEKLALFIIKE